MKFCLLVTVALDIFIREKNNTSIFLGFLLCHFSMQKMSTRSLYYNFGRKSLRDLRVADYAYPLLLLNT